MRLFTRFACADWSGAKGSRHPGIALAVCDVGDEAPRLVTPANKVWSRQAVADWLLAQDDDLLIGFDFSFAPPLIERGSYLPGDDVPTSAIDFWAYVDHVCDDPDLGAASFLEYHHRRHFYLGAADGTKSDYLFWRQCELLNNNSSGRASTVYDAIGAAQVAKASFAGMRFLNHVRDKVTIWPFDAIPADGTVVVEIYTSIAARAAGVAKGRSKVRDGHALDNALHALGSQPHKPFERYTDHATDALITAAWLRNVAGNPKFWAPNALDSKIAATEGWTFGVI